MEQGSGICDHSHDLFICFGVFAGYMELAGFFGIILVHCK